MLGLLISILVSVAGFAALYFTLNILSFSILISVVLGLVAFAIISKKVFKQIGIVNEKAQKAMQQQKFDRAIRIYEDLLPLKKYSFFVTGQVYSYIGMIYYIKSDQTKAEPALKKASSLNWIAKGMLAVIKMKKKEPEDMVKIFDKMAGSHKKEGLVWGLYAYCLDKIRRREDAIAVLEKANKILKGNDERIKNNLIELKNGRRMKMKGFGDQWYQFMLEKPAAKRMQQQQPSYMRMKKNSMYRGR